MKLRYGRWLFGLWVIVCSVYYLGGPHGLIYGWRIVGENARIEQEIVELTRNIRANNHEIDCWQREPFFSEQCAREHLQLARHDETIYYVTKN